ncbi:hypothetical protein [Chlorobaculum limnaeum]|uniref:hypothetical protein n=1 Tax=Chlorobaculum limnaeum TaxID=274537 RepID=UPI0012ED677C|nr:hypothetical protein [Chlorobaculum limnaeum]
MKIYHLFFNIKEIRNSLKYFTFYTALQKIPPKKHNGSPQTTCNSAIQYAGHAENDTPDNGFYFLGKEPHTINRTGVAAEHWY